jgi:hypothetical protein
MYKGGLDVKEPEKYLMFKDPKAKGSWPIPLDTLQLVQKIAAYNTEMYDLNQGVGFWDSDRASAIYPLIMYGLQNRELTLADILEVSGAIKKPMEDYHPEVWYRQASGLREIDLCHMFGNKKTEKRGFEAIRDEIDDFETKATTPETRDLETKLKNHRNSHPIWELLDSLTINRACLVGSLINEELSGNPVFLVCDQANGANGAWAGFLVVVVFV